MPSNQSQTGSNDNHGPAPDRSLAPIGRRAFLRRTVSAGAGMAVARAAGSAAADATEGLPTRVLGRTGQRGFKVLRAFPGRGRVATALAPWPAPATARLALPGGGALGGTRIVRVFAHD